MQRPVDLIEEEKIEKARKSVFGFFVTRTRFTILVILTIIIFGTGSVFTIPRESDPEVTIPVAVISTIYPGASPTDVEQLVTNKIEDKLEDLDDVKLITSTSRLGFSSIVVEFEAEADLDKSIDNLKEKVDEVTGLPDEAEDPFVTEARVNDFPIIVFSLASNLDERRMKHFAKVIQSELEAITGVSEAPISGDRKREFQIDINRSKIERLNLSLNSVVGAIASSNIDIPLGDITIDSVDYNVRTVAKFRSIEDLRGVVVGNIGGTVITVNDIADVRDDFAERTSRSRISVNGKPAVNMLSVSLYKKTGGNILNIVDTAKERIEKLKNNGTIPEGMDVVVSSDYSVFIRKDLNTLGSSGLQAVVLIFFTMLLAISAKEAFISLFSIPFTFLMTIFFLNMAGMTLNSMTLFTLVLSLGLLVDGFIIILEGIFDAMRKGYNSTDASLLSIEQYFKPLISGMLTTVSAFVPMLLVSGILGEYLSIMPITISIALLSSLFISLAIVPAISSVVLSFRQDPEKKRPESFLEKFLTNRLKRKYNKSINIFLVSKKKKVRFGIIILVMFVGAMTLLLSGFVKVELFPKVDVDFTFIDVETPIGTDIDQTDKLVRRVEEYLYTIPEIKTFVTTIGSGSSFGFGNSGGSGENLANFNITFVDADQRKAKSFEINDRIREDLKEIKEGKINVREVTSGPPTGAPIEARIVGEDLNVLGGIADLLVDILEKKDGVIEIETNKDLSPADFTFTLKREELSKSGLRVSDVTGFLRTAIFGVDATEVNVDGEDIDVVVRIEKNSVSTIEGIKNLSILNPAGQAVTLSRVADFSLEPSLASIRHRDFDRTLTVRANLKEGFSSPDVVSEVEAQLNDTNIPAGYQVDFGGEVEDIEKSFQELWSAMILAIILILSILVLQFNSFIKPFVILMELPLMVIGVVIGMVIFRLPFSFSVFLGLISLAGIAVNDAIVLIDKANSNIKEYKMKPREAIADAGESRMQPIFLTSITTIMSIIPLALADEFWRGLSISIAFGLAFATILQLYVVPMLYLKFVGDIYLYEMGLIEKKKKFVRIKSFAIKILKKISGR